MENDNEQIRITEVSFNDVRGGFLDYMGAPIKTIDKVVGYTALMITGEATVTARVYYKIEDIAPTDPSNPPDHSYFIAGVSHDDFTFRSVSNDCTVTFDGNGSTSGSISAFKVVKGQDATLSENQFKLEHHLFDGWNTKSDGSGTSYDDKGTINVSSDVTLYAQWVPFTYAVMFDKNAADATGTMEDEASAYDEEKALSANGFSREGHTFEAWNSKDDGSGDAYKDGALVKNLVETNK